MELSPDRKEMEIDALPDSCDFNSQHTHACRLTPAPVLVIVTLIRGTRCQ
jgi:hypothetical protein